MIRINLLPAEMQVTEFKINPPILMSGVAGFLVILLLPLWWVQYSRRNQLQSEIKSLENELDRYKPIVAQVEALEQAKHQLQQRKSVIEQLENERLRYPYFMEDLLKLLPSNVWLTNMTTTLSPDNIAITVSMDVVALDHYAVADMVSNLETSQIFSEVDLGPITLSQASGTTGQSITFRMTTTYRKTLLTANAIKKP